MKKSIVSIVLVGLVVRLAVLAGAGEVLGAWVRDVSGEVNPQPTAEIGMEEETAEPTILLVNVTPKPQGEDGVSRGEAEEFPTPIATTMSGEGSVHNRSGLEIDIDALAEEGLDLRLQRGEPQVLIFHTHSSEAYTPDEYDRYEASDPYRTEDKNYSVIRVGDVLTERLEACGLTVIHDRELYDYPSYTGSYNRSGAAVEKYLEENPSIKIVIDLHRDALGSGDTIYKTQATLSGKTSAQVMMVMGTGANGLAHPNWRENLKLALYMQNAMDERYPTLARPVELVPERYNQQLCSGMMILEVGSSGNTLREALQAIELYADAVGPALEKLLTD